jgi:death-on-curing protein
VIWLRREALEIAHEMQIDEHGGGGGIRSIDLQVSALARPRNKFEYEKCSVFTCAAAYGYGLAMNHPFIDGNKRVALLAMFMFLRRNGWLLDAPEQEVYEVMTDLAAGAVAEAELAEWLERRSKSLKAKVVKLKPPRGGRKA